MKNGKMVVFLNFKTHFLFCVTFVLDILKDEFTENFKIHFYYKFKETESTTLEVIVHN
jgi:hypothetical protein